MQKEIPPLQVTTTSWADLLSLQKLGTIQATVLDDWARASRESSVVPRRGRWPLSSQDHLGTHPHSTLKSGAHVAGRRGCLERPQDRQPTLPAGNGSPQPAPFSCRACWETWPLGSCEVGAGKGLGFWGPGTP